MSKRILISTTNDGLSDQRIQRTIRVLAAEGHQIRWITVNRGVSKLPDVPAVVSRLNMFFLKGKFFYLEYNIRLLFILLFSQCDVVHSVDLDTLPAAAIIKPIRRFRILFDAHEWFTEVPELKGRPGIRAIWKAIERRFVPDCDHIITVASGIESYYERQYGKAVTLVRNMPESQKSEHPISISFPIPEGDFILYQGALNEGRGLENAIEAVKGSDWKLLLAGAGDIEERLKKQVAENGMQDQVIFCGRLSPEELRLLTPIAWCGLNLLEARSKSYYYSLANKFFDYVQAGIPSLQMMFPEYMQMNAEYKVSILLKNTEAGQIRAHLDDLKKDSNLYSELKSNCREAAKYWNWEHESEQLRKAYRYLWQTPKPSKPE